MGNTDIHRDTKGGGDRGGCMEEKEQQRNCEHTRSDGSPAVIFLVDGCPASAEATAGRQAVVPCVRREKICLIWNHFDPRRVARLTAGRESGSQACVHLCAGPFRVSICACAS